jgi:coenzyme F420-reducing hydrogenase delta subunit
MLVERLVLKEGADAKVYIIADWSIVAEGHWAGNDFLKHKKVGARESCCEKLGRPEQLCIIPVLPLKSKRVKMLYLTRAEYDKLQEIMENIDVRVSPVKITIAKGGDAAKTAFVWCSDEENGMRIRSSVSTIVDLLQKEEFIDKITWPGIKYNDIGG